MYYIGLDVHKKTVSYGVKDTSGQVHQEGKIGATRRELDSWTKTLPQPRTVAMEATIFTGWIYDHLLPHAQQVKVDDWAVRKKLQRWPYIWPPINPASPPARPTSLMVASASEGRWNPYCILDNPAHSLKLALSTT